MPLNKNSTLTHSNRVQSDVNLLTCQIKPHGSALAAIPKNALDTLCVG